MFLIGFLKLLQEGSEGKGILPGCWLFLCHKVPILNTVFAPQVVSQKAEPLNAVYLAVAKM